MRLALFTGLPGAGKTAQLVAEIVRLTEAEPGRPIYAMGINGLKEGLAIPLTMEMLENWWEVLPPGSIIALDECQEEHLMPKDRGNPAKWVQMLAKHRHFACDFLLTTQDPCNMSAFVRRLVGEHVHTVRKFGTSIIQRYKWGRCIDDPYSRREQKQAVQDVGTLPSKVFELYKSSQLHTVKRRIPLKVYLFALAGVVVVGALISIPFMLKRFKDQSTHAVTASVAPGSAVTPRPGAESESLRHTNMPKWMKPRIDGVPWSAPMFDDLKVQAQPRLFCVAVDDGRCTCNTEQGTHYDVGLKQCRLIVQNGLYNPFVAPASPDKAPESRAVDADQPTRREAASPPAGSAASASLSEQVASVGEWKQSPMQASYVPPEIAPRPAYSPRTAQ